MSDEVDLGSIPFSAVTHLGDLLFVSGQVPIDMTTGSTTGVTVGEQTARVLKNLSDVLAAAGASLCDVLKTTAYLTDIAELDAFNGEYRRHFEVEQYPARTLVEVRALAKPEWLVEIDAIARATSNT
jgi:2-iminobutanoate/2-iminopropanoate deaminase